MVGFEHASQPGLSDKEKEDLLHFVVVGGGPTVSRREENQSRPLKRSYITQGIEFSAELYDFIADDLSRIYPHLMDKTRMTLYDVAPTILGSFDSHLSDYAHKKFNRKGIQIKTREYDVIFICFFVVFKYSNSERYVEQVEKNHLRIKGEGKGTLNLPFGSLKCCSKLMNSFA